MEQEKENLCESAYPVHGVTDDDLYSERSPTKFTKTQKIIIIQKCLKDPAKLFEKFSKGISRYSQSAEWENVLSDLRKDGINISDVKTLRKNVSNWTQRATEASDKMKRTGAGAQKPLDEFQLLCLAFIRAAKGDTQVDYIKGPLEPSGSSAVSVSEPQKTSTCTTASTSSSAIKKIATGSVAAENSTPISTSKSASMKVLQEHSNKRRKLDNAQWKERYFESFEAMEQERWRSDEKTSSLKQYNILLQNIKLEKSLGLGMDGIATLRSAIHPELNNYPKFVEETISSEDESEE